MAGEMSNHLSIRPFTTLWKKLGCNHTSMKTLKTCMPCLSWWHLALRKIFQTSSETYLQSITALECSRRGTARSSERTLSSCAENSSVTSWFSHSGGFTSEIQFHKCKALFSNFELSAQSSRETRSSSRMPLNWPNIQALTFLATPSTGSKNEVHQS